MANKANVLIPVLGINTTAPGEFIDSRATPDCQNVEISRSVIEKRIGTSSLGTSMSERVVGLRELQILNNTYFLRIGPTKVELLNKAASTWASVAHAPLTASVSDRVDFAFPLLSAAKIMTFTNGFDNIRKYTGVGNDADLGGTPPICNFMVAFRGYLILAKIASYPQRVQWCDTGDPESWTPASGSNAGAQDLNDDPDEITGIAVFGDYVAVHKNSCIYLGYVVTTDEVFRFDRKNTGIGTCCFATIQNLPNGKQIFLATDGLHMFDGNTAPIIENALMDEIRESLNPQYLNLCWSIIVREKDEYWCAMPLGSQTEPDTIIKYNWRTGQVYKDTRENISACGFYINATQPTWNEKTNSWNSDLTRWNDLIYLSLNPVIALGDNAGQVSKRFPLYNDIAEVISSKWQSKDFTAQDLGSDDQGRLVRWTGMQVWAKGNTLTVQYSIDGGLNWTTVETLTLPSDYPADDAPVYSYFDFISSQARFRFLNETTAEVWSLKKFTLMASLREMR